MSAIEEIAAERRRQIEAEGWTLEHDDGHDRGEMLTAAWCYMQRHADADMWGGNAAAEINLLPAPARWPWDLSWWKPKDRRRDLVRAAALLVAEIERIDRARATSRKQAQDNIALSAALAEAQQERDAVINALAAKP